MKRVRPSYCAAVTKTSAVSHGSCSNDFPTIAREASNYPGSEVPMRTPIVVTCWFVSWFVSLRVCMGIA